MTIPTLIILLIFSTSHGYELGNRTRKCPGSFPSSEICEVLPIIYGMENTDHENIFNDFIHWTYDQFYEVNFPDQPYRSINIDFEVTYRREHFLSILITGEEQVSGYSHSFIHKDGVVMDMLNGKILFLPDLFIHPSNFVERINVIIRSRLAELDPEGKPQIPLLPDRKFRGISIDQPFYMNTSGIIIYFQAQEYTPPAYGPLEISVPWWTVNDILALPLP